MTVDRNKALQSAERLIRQGDVDGALRELRASMSGAPTDLLALNRLGDLLARTGHGREAIECYRGIAEQFVRQGFYPKAIAIHKKILRLDGDCLDSLATLGELYARQKLPGEARVHLGKAAERASAEGRLDRAAEILAKLVEIDPEDPSHRVRLADVRASDGDPSGAGEQLLGVAASQLRAGQIEKAEATYRRAAELLPRSPEPTLGISRCLAARGQDSESVLLLERTAREENAPPGILAELALRYEREGRSEDARALLEDGRAAGMDPAVYLAILGTYAARGEVELYWERMDPIFDRWDGEGSGAGLGGVLRRLATFEKDGHLPALRRLYHLQRRGPDREARVDSLERLVGACQAHGLDEEVAPLLEELRDLAPDSALLAPRPAEDRSAARKEIGEPADLPPLGDEDELEAPAVPLSRADAEWATARLTQAEILEKYGLKSKAVEQIREVVHRFPGQEQAQERWVEILRGEADPGTVARALVGLAVARRAAGHLDGAREAVAEAAGLATLDGLTRSRLARLGIGAPAVPAEPAAAPDLPRDTPAAGAEEDAVLIEFEETGAPETLAVAPVSAVPEEVELEIEPTSVVEPDERPEPRAASAGDSSPDEFDAVAASFGAAFAEFDSPGELDPEARKSLAEVFSEFRRHVEQEVEADDFKTHYELGIAYKEMGLIDGAIEEFRVAVDSPGLRRDACTMIAVCHRERDETEDAAQWYRRAIEAAANEPEIVASLSYELAEVLLRAGDREAALDTFRHVLSVAPSYRDVRDRVAKLEPTHARGGPS